MTLLIQFDDTQGLRRVGLLDAASGSVAALNGVDTTYALALRAMAEGRGLTALAESLRGDSSEPFEAIAAQGRLRVPIDHPDPAHCIVSGTGLTHLGSADARDAMHAKLGAPASELTDSMRMFKLGVEGGKPTNGLPGAQPEWFYKGDGSIVRASGQALRMPTFAEDGGEEPEIAGLYIVDAQGQPWRVGFTLGNEFSDHITERGNYLWLAHSKLRDCGLGPALLVGELPERIEGASRIRDINGDVRWEKPFLSGEANMSHSIANLEHHHFKYRLFRQPGSLHVHFFGTGTLSFADGVRVLPGETFEIEAAPFGPPLRNPLALADELEGGVRKL